MKKLKKAYRYLADRLFELKICIKEFLSESKLKSSAYQAHYKNRLLVEVHSVEKGLGLKNAGPGHSGKVVVILLDKLFSYIYMDFDINDFAFKETFRVLTAYVAFQKQFDTSKFEMFSEIERKYNKLCEKLGQDYVLRVSSELNAGYGVYSREDLLKGTEFDFNGFISSRHSIRTYDGRPLDEDLIMNAAAMANMAPSACNRQPSRIYFSNKGNIVEQIDKLITGSSGFKGETSNYIVVTTDRAAFSKDEQFQWYINGGIYLSYLTLALHSQGIGNCIMQWKAFYKTEKQLKALLNIPAHEAIIAVVGCGYYKDETRCIAAQRRTVADTLRIIK